MADIKKFLDQAGVGELWKSITTELNKKANTGDVTVVDGKVTALDTRVGNVEAKAQANEEAIGVLNGTGAGSVTKTVADAIAVIIAEAPENLDTLKEISDWITSHGSDAAEMNSAIQKAQGDATAANTLAGQAKTAAEGAQSDVDALATLVGQLPEGEESVTIIAYIQKLVSGIASDGAMEALTARVAVLEGKSHHEHTNATILNGITQTTVDKWNAAEGNAKAYTDTAIGNLDTMQALTAEEIKAAIAAAK